MVLVFAVSICARLYWIPQKVGLFLDESYSIVISECKHVFVPDNKVYSGLDVRKAAYGVDFSFHDALSDIKQLRKDNKDPPHTNLYYSILRLCLTGVDCNLRSIIDRGCYLNIFFWLFSFYFMYRLLRCLFNDNLVISLTLLVASISTSSLSNAMFIRPYVLQEALFVALTYVFVRIYQSIESQNHKYCRYCWTYTILFSVLLSFVLLSGYLAIMYVFLLIGNLMIISWIKNKKQITLLIALSFAFSIMLANVFYKKYLNGFFCGSEVINNSYRLLLDYKNFPIHFFVTTLKALEAIFVNLLFPFLGVCLVFFNKICFKNYTKNIWIAVIILACSILWSLSSFAVVPYMDYRYIVAVFPMLTLIIPIVINETLALNTKKTIVVITALIYAAIAFNPPYPNSFLVKQRIRHLHRSDDGYTFNKKPEIPVLVYCSRDPWRITDIIPYLNDNQKYQFVKSYDSFIKQLSVYEHIFVIVENSKEICSKFVIPSEYEIIASPNFESSAFIVCYELHKKFTN